MDIKVIFFDVTYRYDYSPEKHKERVHKFLFYRKETVGGDTDYLLVGDQEVGDHLSLIRTAKKWIEDLENFDIFTSPDGAGNCENGVIRHWRSDGFEVLTPSELRPIIQNALRM
jgi:hypothetical protein